MERHGESKNYVEAITDLLYLMSRGGKVLPKHGIW